MRQIFTDCRELSQIVFCKSSCLCFVVSENSIIFALNSVATAVVWGRTLPKKVLLKLSSWIIGAIGSHTFVLYPLGCRTGHCQPCSWNQTVEYRHWQGNNCRHQCQAILGIFNPTNPAWRRSARCCREYHQQQGRFHKWAHRPSYGRCAQEVAGDRNSMRYWLAEDAKTP